MRGMILANQWVEAAIVVVILLALIWVVMLRAVKGAPLEEYPGQYGIPDRPQAPDPYARVPLGLTEREHEERRRCD